MKTESRWMEKQNNLFRLLVELKTVNRCLFVTVKLFQVMTAPSQAPTLLSHSYIFCPLFSQLSFVSLTAAVARQPPTPTCAY